MGLGAAAASTLALSTAANATIITTEINQTILTGNSSSSQYINIDLTGDSSRDFRIRAREIVKDDQIHLQGGNFFSDVSNQSIFLSGGNCALTAGATIDGSGSFAGLGSRKLYDEDGAECFGVVNDNTKRGFLGLKFDQGGVRRQWRGHRGGSDRIGAGRCRTQLAGVARDRRDRSRRVPPQAQTGGLNAPTFHEIQPGTTYEFVPGFRLPCLASS